jgi:hypothetical protein
MAIHELGPSLPAWQKLEWNGDNIVNRDDPCKWGGDGAPPDVGSRVIVRVNKIGAGKVLGYFLEEGFLGVLVQPDNAPDWYRKQNGGNVPCHVFGAELIKEKA